MLSIEKSAPQSLPGGKYWALGGIFIFVGFLLIGADEWLPELISTTIANNLIAAAVAFYYLAINHAIDHQSSNKLVISILGLTFLGEVIFTSLLPNCFIRMLILLAALVILTFLGIRQLRYLSEPGEIAPKIMIIVFFNRHHLVFVANSY